MEAAQTKPIFDEKMKALAEAAKKVDMQIPKELKKTPRIVEKSQLRPGMKGVLPCCLFAVLCISNSLPSDFRRPFGHIECVWCEGYCQSHGSFE